MNTPVKFVGFPDGPKVLVPEIGKEVGTFVTAPGGKHPALRHHVPLKCRGPYRPEELANYDNGIPYRTDPFGYLLCASSTYAGEKCGKRAVNRSPDCNVHGGRLHPLDKLQKEMEDPTNDGEGQALSRYQQYLAGQIGVDDLDDEELACGGFKDSRGHIYKPKTLPRELITAFNKAIFERAQQELRANTVHAATTVAEIMRNPKIEPDIRLKAASLLLDRNLGKAPQVVALTSDRGFDEVFSDLFTGSRDESRQQRSITNIVDAEVVEDPGERSNPVDTVDESSQPNATGDQQSFDGPTGNEVVPNETVRGDNAENQSPAEKPRDARLFERNPAIIEPMIETKPFEYDLSDHSQEIKKATQKRYASRALNVDLTTPDYPLERVESDGFVKWRDPKGQAGIRPSKKAEKHRKTYTLSDF